MQNGERERENMLTVSPVRWSPGRLWFWFKVCLATAILTALLFGVRVFAQGKSPRFLPGRPGNAAVALGQPTPKPYNLTTPHSFLPYILGARYGRALDQRSAVETSSLVRSCPQRTSSFCFLFFIETSRSDQAVLQAERRSPYLVLRREFQEKTMFDSLPNLRPRASACVVSMGTPDSSNLDGLLARGRRVLDRWIIATDNHSGSFILLGEGGEPPSSGHPNPFFG